MSTISPHPERIYLFRHAQAVWPEPTMRDFERPLSKRGVDDADAMAQRLKEGHYLPEIILSSSAMRCRQTADAAYRALDRRPSCRFIDDFYQAAPVTYIEAISDHADRQSVMICGHNPGIEETLLMLVGYEAFNVTCPYGFPTAGVAVLDHSGNTGNGLPEWKVTAFLAP
ncbi:histidine phosphatase family protein [uncultured Martelella sp.]|uniref:SixA phosphatase family protein n=1 Tax=uncultured Martelella sp. TaxID=392331 RepID=UPI0029C7D937|nr:histidine phosphatase family protein [uncultured Martelella sp.]